jgi:hypothetical protein
MANKTEKEETIYRDSSILDDLQLIYSRSAECGLSKDFFNRPGKVHEKLRRLSVDLGLTPLQVVLLSIILENNERGAKLRDICSHTGCYYIELLSHQDDIRFMVSKGYIAISEMNDIIGSRLMVTETPLLYWGRNIPVSFEPDEHMAYKHIMDYMVDKYASLEDNMTNAACLKKDIEYMLGLYKDTFLPIEIDTLLTSDTNRWYTTCIILYILVCNNYSNPGPTYAEMYKTLFDTFKQEQMDEVRQIVDYLCKNRIVKITKNGQVNLTKKYLKALNLPKDNERTNVEEKVAVRAEDEFRKLCDDSCTLISHESIIEKHLFYNGAEESKLSELSYLLTPESYSAIENRLSANGLNAGINCLLYGGPGTGKTEFVYQVAKKCGRSILKVDFSSLRNRYVGDSEKAIRKVFAIYRTLVNKCDNAPILLLNECDGLLGKRVEITEGSDQLNNACQAILLEELENLRGISFSTSNVPQKMDDAFERRFLYKVEFHTPDEQTRKKIWLSLVDGLDEKDASILAGGYSLSGGQISNVVRKMNIHSVLHGNESVELSLLKDMCKDEISSYNKSLTSRGGSIGFTIHS